jgi:hypothetical protein
MRLPDSRTLSVDLLRIVNCYSCGNLICFSRYESNSVFANEETAVHSQSMFRNRKRNVGLPIAWQDVTGLPRTRTGLVTPPTAIGFGLFLLSFFMPLVDLFGARCAVAEKNDNPKDNKEPFPEIAGGITEGRTVRRIRHSHVPLSGCRS